MNTKKFLGSLLIAVLGGVAAIAVYSTFFNPAVKVVEVREQPQARFVAGMETVTDFTYAAEASLNAVVHVKTKYMNTTTYNPLYDFFFGDRGGMGMESQPVMSSGSGVIVSTDGYIVTNNHVIEKSDLIEVVLNDNRAFTAKLIATDPTTDLALLKVDAENLPILKYGDSESLKVGEWVLAVGNPFNLTSTVTAGIVSAKARNISILNSNYAIEAFIQTDAAVNPGNSGGALVNTRGELIGINTAIASRTGSYSGYSFAIPSSIVRKVISDLMEYGVVQRAVLGVSIDDLSAEKAKELNIEKIEGVYVKQTFEGGAAKSSGIEVDDVILKIGAVKVGKVAELQEQISKYRPGDAIKVTVNRKGKIKEFDVILKNKSGNTDLVSNDLVAVLGASLEELTPQERSSIGIKNGIRVTGLQSGKLMKAGIKEGFIIRFINRKSVATISELQQILDESQGGIYIEGIYPNGMTAYYAFGLK